MGHSTSMRSTRIAEPNRTNNNSNVVFTRRRWGVIATFGRTLPQSLLAIPYYFHITSIALPYYFLPKSSEFFRILQNPAEPCRLRQNHFRIHDHFLETSESRQNPSASFRTPSESFRIHPECFRILGFVQEICRILENP